VRKANEKSFRQIHEEIRTAQTKEIRDNTIGGGKLPRTIVFLLKLPYFLRKIGWWKLRRDPFLKKEVMGTVGVTSVGMFGSGRAHIIMIGFHSLEFGIGGISKSVSAGTTKESLSLTVMFDEDVNYGAPAARFISRLSELMQSGFALESIE